MPTIPLFSREAPYVLALVALSLVMILGPLKTIRRSIINTCVFYVACLAGDLVASVLKAQMLTVAGTWLREICVFGEGLAAIRFIGLALFQVLLPKLKIQISGILADIMVIVGYIIWVFIRLNLAGVELGHLVTTSAILTAVLAISMQDTLGNLLGGLALQMDNSLEIGDWIKIDDLSGQVTDIQWRFTSLMTRSGEKVVVPNSQLMKGRYYVLCSPDSPGGGWRRNISFNVDLAVQPSRVLRLVTEDIINAMLPNVAKNPPPSCVLMEFGPGYAQYTLRYWLTDPRLDDPTDSEVRTHILATLQRNGIRLATDDHTIHLIKEGVGHREEVESRELKRRIQAIRGIELFKCLSEQEIEDLAKRTVYAPFAKGDVLTRQGAVAHWLYVITSGQAEAWWQPPQGEKRLMEIRGPGSVFGEIGLMTGAPRRATVIATEDVEAYRIDKEAFQRIIQARPELADLMSSTLERRVKQFDQLEQDYREETGNHVPTSQATLAIGRRIRDFFGLKG